MIPGIQPAMVNIVATLERLVKIDHYQTATKHEPIIHEVWYRWFSARLQYIQYINNGDTAVLH